MPLPVGSAPRDSLGGCRSQIELAAQVPDGVAVLDEAGGITALDESAAHEYINRVGLPTDCKEGCAERGHIIEI